MSTNGSSSEEPDLEVSASTRQRQTVQELGHFMFAGNSNCSVGALHCTVKNQRKMDSHPFLTLPSTSKLK